MLAEVPGIEAARTGRVVQIPLLAGSPLVFFEERCPWCDDDDGCLEKCE